MRATHPKIQDPSEWAGTNDWLNIILFFGSIPLAKKAAVVSLILFLRVTGSCLVVIACKSTTHYTHSFSSSFCRLTKFLIAPR